MATHHTMPTLAHAAIVADCFDESGVDYNVLASTFPGALESLGTVPLYIIGSQEGAQCKCLSFWVYTDYDAVFLMADVLGTDDTWRWDGTSWQKL